MGTESMVAVGPGEDPRRIGVLVHRAYEEFVLSHRVPPSVRSVVADSWLRCTTLGAGADGCRLPPVRMAGDELEEYRSRHPLAGLLPLFRALLGDLADEGEHIVALTDAGGTLLWVRGRPALLDRAERMNFVEGAAWSEAEAGTNAPGTALAVGRPVQVFVAEHFNTAMQAWSCSAAPIRDLRSGRLLGVIDLTGGENVATSQALALVRATARAGEAELARRTVPTGERAWPESRGRARPESGVRAWQEPGGRVPLAWSAPEPAGARAGAPAVRLTVLGRDSALLEVDGRARRLSRRHSEIVTILAVAMGGLSADRLAVELSERELSASTVRAEMTRLRAVLGEGLLGSRPYALRLPVESDLAEVRDLVAAGRVGDALAAYAGPLLPASEAPTIVAHRTALEQQVRGAVLAAGDPALLRRWVNAPWGSSDAEAWRNLGRRLPGGSPQSAAATARARALDEELALPPSLPLPGARRGRGPGRRRIAALLQPSRP